MANMINTYEHMYSHQINTMGKYYMHQLCLDGDFKGVLKNINKGYDLDLLDEYGQSCLHIACSGKHIKMVKVLLDNGANVNLMEHREENLGWMAPIHIAVLRQSMEMVNILIKHGADIFSLTGGPNGGDSVLHIASSSSMANLLIRSGANIDSYNLRERKTPLICAIENSMIDVVRTLVISGADVNMCDTNGKSAIVYANDDSRCAEWIDRVKNILVGA